MNYKQTILKTFVILVFITTRVVCSQDQLLEPVDVTSIEALQRKLNVYTDHDEHLKELKSVLATQQAQILVYNNLIAAGALTQDQLNLLSDVSFKNLIEVSKTEIESLSSLSTILMQGNNISPSWQIAKYGKVLGTASFVKNLLLPRDFQTSIYAGVGALTAFVGLKNLSTTSTIVHIHPPVGTEIITINNNDSQHKLATTLTACALGAGTVVAGTQLWNSWMYEQNSRDILTDKIKAIRTSNGLVGQSFALAQIQGQQQYHAQTLHSVHGAVNRLEEGLLNDRSISASRHHQLHSTTQNIQAKVDQLTSLSLSQNNQLHEISQSQRLTLEQSKSLENLFIQAGGKVDLMMESLQAEFGEIKGLVLGNMMLQMKIHEENSANFKDMNTNLQSLKSSKSSPVLNIADHVRLTSSGGSLLYRMSFQNQGLKNLVLKNSSTSSDLDEIV